MCFLRASYSKQFLCINSLNFHSKPMKDRETVAQSAQGLVQLHPANERPSQHLAPGCVLLLCTGFISSSLKFNSSDTEIPFLGICSTRVVHMREKTIKQS